MLRKVLGKVGSPSHSVTLDRFLDSDINSWVNEDGALADTVPVVNGVKQGRVLGPHHCNLFCSYFQDRFKNQCSTIPE